MLDMFLSFFFNCVGYLSSPRDIAFLSPHHGLNADDSDPSFFPLLSPNFDGSEVQTHVFMAKSCQNHRHVHGSRLVAGYIHVISIY